MSVRPRRRAGNIQALKVELWGAIRAASAVITDPEADADLKLKAASTLATAGGVYLRILEGHETEDRVAQMEAMMHTVVAEAHNGYGTHEN
jgi:hypothetical protein